MSVIARDEQPSWLATVAHEIRGPLTALETASELLDRDFDSLDPTQIRVMVSGIHRRALWMRGLMENLLCSALIHEGRLSVHARPLDIVELAREVDGIVRPLLERRGQNLRIVAPISVMAEADAHRVSQVLLNLISNAHKYSGPNTQIDLEIATDGELARVSVSDRGPGLPKEIADNAFLAYDRAGRGGGDGLGIGLWVVRSIMHAHGGRVGVSNRAGGGATFWFELRLAVAVPLQEFTPTDAAAMATEGLIAL